MMWLARYTIFSSCDWRWSRGLRGSQESSCSLDWRLVFELVFLLIHDCSSRILMVLFYLENLNFSSQLFNGSWWVLRNLVSGAFKLIYDCLRLFDWFCWILRIRWFMTLSLSLSLSLSRVCVYIYTIGVKMRADNNYPHPLSACVDADAVIKIHYPLCRCG
jgi:hypothetical protein